MRYGYAIGCDLEFEREEIYIRLPQDFVPIAQFHKVTLSLSVSLLPGIEIVVNRFAQRRKEKTKRKEKLRIYYAKQFFLLILPNQNNCKIGSPRILSLRRG